MRAWPLRWTIPAIALVLVLLTELVIGGAVLVLLHRTLTSQVDRKLEDSVTQLFDRPGIVRDLEDGNDGMGGMRQQPRPLNDVVVVVYRADGTVATALTDTLNDGRKIPSVTVNLDATQPYTTRSGGDSWRVLVRPTRDGDASVAVMLPLRDVGATSTALGRGIVVLGLVLAAVAAALAALATRRSLRPLKDAERTAAAIAQGDLTQRVPSYSPGTEAGSLAASLNVMLDQLARSMAATQASEQRLKRFVSDASHELRTPLAAIRGYAELHRMGADDAGQAVARIEANAQRMTALVDDLLLLARADESAAHLTGDEFVDLGALLEETAADVRAQDPSRTVTVAAATGAVVRGSRRHLAQLFANLAGNALHHTPAGTTLDLAVSSVGGRVVATVRDHGQGFGEEHAARAFERFYRADTSRTRDTGGSGLGLAIVAAIVAAHGGSVRAADAVEGTGAIITVNLPAA